MTIGSASGSRPPVATRPTDASTSAKPSEASSPTKTRARAPGSPPDFPNESGAPLRREHASAFEAARPHPSSQVFQETGALGNTPACRDTREARQNDGHESTQDLDEIRKSASTVKDAIYAALFPSGIPQKIALFFIGPSCNGKSTLRGAWSSEARTFGALTHENKLPSALKRLLEESDTPKKELSELVAKHEKALSETEDFKRFAEQLPEIMHKSAANPDDSIDHKLKHLKAIKHFAIIQDHVASGRNVLVDLRAGNTESVSRMVEHLQEHGYTSLCISSIVVDHTELRRRWEARDRSHLHGPKGEEDWKRVEEEADEFKRSGCRQLQALFGPLFRPVRADPPTGKFAVMEEAELKSLGYVSP